MIPHALGPKNQNIKQKPCCNKLNKEFLIGQHYTHTHTFIYVKVKVIHSCLTLCDPMDYTVHGILQARILEWAAIPSPTDLPDPGIKPGSPVLQVDSLAAELPGKPIYINHQPTVLLTNLQPGQGATGQLVFAPCRGGGGDGAPSYTTHSHGSQAGLLPAGSSARCSQWPWLLSPSHLQATGLPHSTAARFPQQHPKGWGEVCPPPQPQPRDSGRPEVLDRQADRGQQRC